MSAGVFFYCPDRHLVYDGRTPDRQGVGGGITARIRMAEALVRQGCRVTVACNCSRASRYRGVLYRPLSQARLISEDVLVVHSSGGDLDITSVRELEILSSLRILFVGGVDCPKGAGAYAPAFIYAPSNFLRLVIQREWAVPGSQVFVSPHGVSRRSGPLWAVRRSNRLIYTSHPSKGLDAALGILRELRNNDSKFTNFELHLYGGDRLWGGAASQPVRHEGVFDGGLIDQRTLRRQYARASIALHLQTRLEPFGLTLVESMAAGCIVLASPVGAYPELVRHGFNGFLIEGDPASKDTQRRAAELIRSLGANPEWSNLVRRNAVSWPLDWDTIARAWLMHWKSLKNPPAPVSSLGCSACGAGVLAFADGYHCASCGHYSREL